MDEIICATRGGEGSRAVQLAAIERAKSSGRRLVFLYVVAPNSIGGVIAPLQTAVREELVWMGKALLRTAQQRAYVAGLDAEIVIREGRVQDKICDFIAERQASLLLLGAPRGSTANVFGDDLVERFAENIQQTSGISVEIVRPETIRG